jgi:hypothetical protein
MCTRDLDTAAGRNRLDVPTRRDMLKRLTALGLTAPAAVAALNHAALAGPMSFLDRGEFVNGLTDLVDKARSPQLAAYRAFALASSDMPWKDIDLPLLKGQEVTFLIGGRIWLSREHDIWFEPGTSFNARSRGRRPIFNPMNNTGTMTAAHDGPVEIARAFGEWANEDGELWTPPEAYTQVEVQMYGLALAWQGKAVDGLKSLAAHGDVGGVIGAEIARLESPRRLPEGWHNIYMSDGGPVIFNDLGNGEISCQAHKKAGILQRSVSVDLMPDTKLSWRWIVEELPSALPENQIVTHDYLSIGAEYDDGQDLTYLWSSGLPVGEVFRCPFPRWTPIETHVIIRSGHQELGAWLEEERDLHADYTTHIGGPARKIVRVWLLGISMFQRRLGACRFADIGITRPDGSVIRL